jgi:hypothetical protein
MGVSQMSCLTFAITMPIGSWHPLLPAALRSLSLQSSNLKLAVLDASNDPRVAAALDLSPVQITYRYHGPDDGQAAAIASGWRQVDGEILAWLNADDLLLPDALKKVEQTFRSHPDTDVVYGNSTIIGEDGIVIGNHGQVTDITDRITFANQISQPSCFFKRKPVERIGGLNENLEFAMDWELWVRLYLDGCKFIHSPDFFSAVYWGQGTKTSQLTARRLMELFSLACKFAGPLNATRKMAGIFTQASSPNSFLHTIAKRRSSTQTPGQAKVFWAADLNPREAGSPMVSLPILNVFDRPRSSLEISTDNPCVEIFADKISTIHLTGTSCWRCDLKSPTLPGEITTLNIAALTGDTRVKYVKWMLPE